MSELILSIDSDLSIQNRLMVFNVIQLSFKIGLFSDVIVMECQFLFIFLKWRVKF